MTIGAHIVYFRGEGTSIIVDATTETLPTIVHWGQDLGDFGQPGSHDEQANLRNVVTASAIPSSGGQLDTPIKQSICPLPSEGWSGTPGLEGHRSGKQFSPRFEMRSIEVRRGIVAPLVSEPDLAQGQILDSLTVIAVDVDAELELHYELHFLHSGVIRYRATLHNLGADQYQLNYFNLSIPVDPHASELLEFTGRWIHERAEQRKPFTFGTHSRDVRKGRSHDASLLLIAGEPGFTYETGEVWGVHTAWSGNHRLLAEKLPSGHSHMMTGELLQPGEIALESQDSYTTPWTYGSWGSRSGGLNELSARLHTVVRQRAHRPTKPRLVHLNVWEAVYFNHDLETLTRLADHAAAVGVERFVLDDGWFQGRRDDTAGLGDWYVDLDVWPDGLGPLIRHVKSLNMEFGLWFEPEMISPNSDLARNHPEWILAPSTARQPLLARHQQVLNLTNPEAFAYIRDRMTALLDEYDVDYVKWDHNRELLEAGSQESGRAAVHGQTHALYSLMQYLKGRFPHIEFESCAGGGGRIDYSILAYTDRVWASDCIDAHERQQIEAGTGLLVPPEIMGSHVGSGRAHTTGRRHDLDFRAATSLFGHMGIEWNLLEATPTEQNELAQWIAIYKDHRDLLHTGTVIRLNRVDALWVHGVVNRERTQAIFAATQMETGIRSAPIRTRFVGLDPDRMYAVTPLEPSADLAYMPEAWKPQWWPRPLELSGRVLMSSGIQLPAQQPDHTLLLSITATKTAGATNDHPH